MRKLMWFAVGFAAASGICAYFYSQWLPAFLLAALVLCVAFCLIALKKRKFQIPAVIAFGLAVAFGWFLIYDGIYLQEIAKLDGEIVNLSVTVSDYSYETDYGCGFDGNLELDHASVRVIVYLNDNKSLEPGDVVSGRFRCRFTTDGGAEEPLYQRSKGVLLILYQSGEICQEEADHISAWQYPAIWRQKVKDLLTDVFPRDVAAITKALLLGDTREMDYETKTAFKVAGISHIVAVSGLHVSILFSLISIIAIRRRWLTALLGIPALLLFAAVVGFTPSVTRAVLMQILFILATLFDKEYDPLTGLSAAAIIMLIINPLVITSVSFMLSASCMLGIFLVSNPIKNWLMASSRLGRWKSKIVGGLASGISITLGTMITTTPLVSGYFGVVSLVSVLTNLLTLWVVTFVFQGILLVCALSLLWPAAAAVLATIEAYPIRYVVLVAKLLSSMPLSAIYTQSHYTILWLVFAYVLLLVFLLIRKKPVVLFSTLALAGLCLAIFLSWLEPMTDPYRMTVLDVGQGQAILLQSSGKTYLVDCGGEDGDDVADITAETLLASGINKIDGVILTHLDDDHANGLSNLLSRIEADVVFVPCVEGSDAFIQQLPSGIATESVLEDTFLRYEDTVITIFPPMSYESDNENSLCILFQCGNCDILITGDRSEIGERILLGNYDLPKVDVLVVGHHGSKSSTCEHLLETLQPKYAMISVGEGNPYGHPAESVLDRLEEYGCIVYRTDKNGTIIYRG